VRAYIANSAASVGTLDASALAPALNTDATKAHAPATESHDQTLTPEQTQPELVENE
jgi:hypothetical protein